MMEHDPFSVALSKQARKKRASNVDPEPSSQGGPGGSLLNSGNIPPGKDGGGIVFEAEALGERILLLADGDLKPKTGNLVDYRPGELDALREAGITRKDLKLYHAARKIFKGNLVAIKKPGRDPNRNK